MTNPSRVLRWILAIVMSLFAGLVGALLGISIGFYFQSLLIALFLAWIGFTVTAYFTFLLSGVMFRIKTAAFALPVRYTIGKRNPN